MVFSILCVLAVVTAVVVGVQDRRSKMPWGKVGSEIGGVLVLWVIGGGVVMVLSAGASSLLISPNTGWEVQSETTYTVAENSDIVTNGSSIEFVESRDGKLGNVKLYIDNDVVYAEDSETPRTVTVREEHRELGTALFPWGVGDSKSIAVIK